MGKSKSIEEQQRKNEEFQKYIQDMNTNMEQRLDGLNKELEKMQKEHYDKLPDKALLIEGKYSHLTTMSEWSLKSISLIIDSCSKAIFGSKEPNGSKKEDTDKEVSSSIKAIKDREAYIANAAFDLVQSIVGSFHDTTSTSVERKLDGKPIAPGMTLFIGIENNAYSANTFFSNEKIVQTIFVFKVYYSIKEGQSQSMLSDLQLYEDQKEVFRKKIEEFGRLVDDLDPLDEAFDEKFTKYMNRAELMNKRMDIISDKIKKLAENKVNEEREVCNRITEHIRGARLRLMDAPGQYSVHSTPFTFTAGRERAYDRIQQNLPRYAHLESLQRTDYVGNHFFAIFSSNKVISEEDANRWVSTALNRIGNFHFDTD